MWVSRRGLCVGVGSFTAAGGQDGEERDLTPFEDLDYAVEYTCRLHAALQAAGYDTELLINPADLGAARLGDRVEQHITGDGVAVVHVLSHGEHVDVGGVYVVGSDGTWSKRTRVEDWRIQVAADPSAPMTLFLLDLCHAGGGQPVLAAAQGGFQGTGVGDRGEWRG